jgi:hypothetical protein
MDHPQAKLHLDGKRGACPLRKMGYFTVLGDTIDEARKDALAVREGAGNGVTRIKAQLLFLSGQYLNLWFLKTKHSWFRIFE